MRICDRCIGIVESRRCRCGVSDDCNEVDGPALLKVRLSSLRRNGPRSYEDFN